MSELTESYSELLKKLQKPRHIKFFLRFIEVGEIASAYRYAYGKSANPDDENFLASRYASLLGRRILNKAGFTVENYLEASGHGDDKVVAALDKLYEINPDKYLNHIETLRKLGQKSVEIQAGEGVQINIVTSKPKESDETS